jgi:hypothetical protein
VFSSIQEFLKYIVNNPQTTAKKKKNCIRTCSAVKCLWQISANYISFREIQNACCLVICEISCRKEIHFPLVISTLVLLDTFPRNTFWELLVSASCILFSQHIFYVGYWIHILGNLGKLQCYIASKSEHKGERLIGWYLWFCEWMKNKANAVDRGTMKLYHVTCLIFNIFHKQ